VNLAELELLEEDLRRVDRVSVCCRVVVRDRYGVWTAVTEDICAHGCRILTPRLLRSGSRLHLTLSSDLFPEDLETVAEVMWSTPDQLGVSFANGTARPMAPHAWIDKVLEYGAVPGESTIVPVVTRVVGRAVAPRALRVTTPPRLVRMPVAKTSP
jgi:hypothetical protein